MHVRALKAQKTNDPHIDHYHIISWHKATASPPPPHVSEQRNLRRKFRNRKPGILKALFWSPHQRFFRSLCIASKVNKAISLTKEALKDGHCTVNGLQSTGEARAKGAASGHGIYPLVLYSMYYSLTVSENPLVLCSILCGEVSSWFWITWGYESNQLSRKDKDVHGQVKNRIKRKVAPIGHE